MKKFSKVLLSVLLFLFLISCATTNTIKWDKMSSKAKAVLAMQIYNQEYQDYKLKISSPSKLTEHEKDVLRNKKIALTQLYDVIEAYNSYVLTGEVPPEMLERKLLEGLNTVLDIM